MALVHKPGCSLPHPEFEDEYTSDAKGEARLTSCPGCAAAGVLFDIETDLLEGGYKAGVGRASDVEAFPFRVGIPNKVEAGISIPVHEGGGVSPFIESSDDRSSWTDREKVTAFLSVAGYATSTSNSDFWDGYAKASANATIHRTTYVLTGKCQTCNATEKIELYLKEPSNIF
jgi:hypothetical protein